MADTTQSPIRKSRTVVESGIARPAKRPIRVCITPAPSPATKLAAILSLDDDSLGHLGRIMHEICAHPQAAQTQGQSECPSCAADVPLPHADLAVHALADGAPRRRA